jgi:hypothetical protein
MASFSRAELEEMVRRFVAANDALGRTVMTLDGRAPYPGGQRPARV